ncbi:MAG: hypothetical protein RLZZ531_2056 [Bacteroidota bacterium]|jgi:hypothetical protein
MISTLYDSLLKITVTLIIFIFYVKYWFFFSTELLLTALQTAHYYQASVH